MCATCTTHDRVVPGYRVHMFYVHVCMSCVHVCLDVADVQASTHTVHSIIVCTMVYKILIKKNT